MSYILDALRRADAERQRGSVPGLNTPGAVLQPAAPPATLARGPRRWVLGAGAVVALAALGWLALRAGPVPQIPAAPVVQAPVVLPVPPVPAAQGVATAPTPVPGQLPTAGAAAVPPAPVVVVVPPPVPAPAAIAAQPVAATATLPAAPVSPVAPAPAAPVPPAAPAQRVPALAELPEALRRQVPALALGGSVYSEQAAQRLVIVNGQVVHEGDEAAPGVRVIHIRPKTLVLAVGGQRFEMPL